MNKKPGCTSARVSGTAGCRPGHFNLSGFFIIIPLLLIISSCIQIPELPAIDAESISTDQKNTLLSLEKIDNYPLYTMTWHGGYDSGHAGAVLQALGIETGACTSFSAGNEKGEKLFCRNHDWPESPVLLVFTRPEGKYASVSTVDLSLLGYHMDTPIGSLQERSALLYSVYMPLDGMNEKGLAMGAMVCIDTDKQKEGGRKTFSTGIIRIVLDNAATVKEALDIISEHGIVHPVIPVHYLITDSTGDTAVVEFAGGETLVQLPGPASRVLTNFRLAGNSGRLLEKMREYRKNGKISGDIGDSYRRYITVLDRLEKTGGMLSETAAMKLLESASLEQKTIYGDFFTVWSVVYNLHSGNVNIAVGRNYRNVHRLNLK